MGDLRGEILHFRLDFGEFAVELRDFGAPRDHAAALGHVAESKLSMRTRFDDFAGTGDEAVGIGSRRRQVPERPPGFRR